MLKMHPSCENCGKPLSPDGPEAMICSFECTFCRDCALDLLANVCPKCGGRFSHFPLREARFLEKFLPSPERMHRPVDLEAHGALVARLVEIPPES